MQEDVQIEVVDGLMVELAKRPRRRSDTRCTRRKGAEEDPGDVHCVTGNTGSQYKLELRGCLHYSVL